LAALSGVDDAVFVVSRCTCHGNRFPRHRCRVAEVGAAHLANAAVDAMFFRLPPMSGRHLQVTFPVVGTQVVQGYANGA